MPDVQPTNNPVPSDNPADARDNFKRIDEVVNSTENLTSPTRTGVQLVTLHRYSELIQPNIDGAEAAAASAAASAAAAEAAVSGLNYQGLWPDSGGSADKGDAYQTQVGGTPTGQYFTALQNTTVDPVGDDVNWRLVVSNQSLGGVTNYQAASVAGMLTGETVNGTTIQLADGQYWSSGGTVWKHNGSSTGTIDDFDRITDYYCNDAGEFNLNGITSAMRTGNAIAQPGVYSLNGAVTDIRFGSLEGQGPTLTDVSCLSGEPFVDYDSSRYDELKISRLRVLGPGAGHASGASAFFMDGVSNSTRELLSQIRFQDWPTAIMLNSGWGRKIDQCFISSCGTGIGSGDSVISPSISGSGTTISDTYIAGCDVGIDDSAQWNMLMMNVIIEDCVDPYIQNQGGNGRTLIDLWLEGNTNPIQWRSGSVVINGRGVTFEDVDLFSGRPEDSIIWLDRSGGLRVFRNSPDTAEFWVDGEGVHGFKPVKADVGFEILDNNADSAKVLNFELGGGITAEGFGVSSGPFKLSMLTGKYHQFSSQIDAMPEVGFSVWGQSSSSNGGGGIITCRMGSGRYNTSGGTGTDIEDRWELDASGHLVPLIDATYNLGRSGSERVDDLYIVNAPTVGSDVRIKTDVKSMTQELLDFALSVELKHWKFKDGERYHSGIIITEDFLSKLDDVMKLDECAAFCKSVFTDDDGNPITKILHGVELGDVWQVRQDEWQNIMLEAMRRKIMAL